MKRRVRIALVGLLNDFNLGDPAIFEMTRYFIEELCRKHRLEVAFEYIDIGEYKVPRYRCPELNRQYERFEKSFYRHYYKRSFTKFDRVERDCKRIIKRNLDAVIFVGGGLIKYRYQEYLHKMMDIVLNRAEQINVPVMFSGVGVEGYDDSNEICKRLKITLNRKCIKVIAARDDLETLRNCYLSGNDRIRLVKVSDAACSMKRLYPPAACEGNTVGLGVMRSEVFSGHGVCISEEKLIELYAEMYEQLSKHGKRCLIFTNGMKKDQEFAEKLCVFLNVEKDSSEILCPRPRTVAELVQLITRCGAVIATRLHTGIIAYAYEIPFVGLVWSPKQFFFGESIGCRDRFFAACDLNVEMFVTKLLEAIESGYPDMDAKSFKDSNPVELERFLSEYVV